MEYRQGTQEDLDFVRLNPFEGAVKDYPYLEMPDENCYAVTHEGEVLGVGGLQMKWEGVGFLWLMCTVNFKTAGSHRALHIIKETMDNLIKKNNLHRAEAAIRVDFPQAIKMIKFFGFEREGLMRQYCPDKSDSYLYSRII